MLAPLGKIAYLAKRRWDAVFDPGEVREVTVSSNRQVGLASEFARRLEVGPRSKLLEALVRLPDGSYGVLLMRPPKSYAQALSRALAGKTPAKEFLAKLRAEWPE